MTHEHHAPFVQTGVDGREVHDRLPPVSSLVRPVPTQPVRPQRFVRQVASTLMLYVAGGGGAQAVTADALRGRVEQRALLGGVAGPTHGRGGGGRE